MPDQIYQAQVVQSYASRSAVSPATMVVCVACFVLGLGGIGGIMWGFFQPVLHSASQASSDFPGALQQDPKINEINRTAATLSMVLAIVNIMIAPLLIWGAIKCVNRKQYLFLANVVAAAAVYALIRYAVRLVAVSLPLNQISQETGWNPSNALHYNTLMAMEFGWVCGLVIFYAAAYMILHYQIKREKAIPVASIG